MIGRKIGATYPFTVEQVHGPVGKLMVSAV